MLNGLLEAILGIIGLSLVVLVHESGHFAAARFAGIRVETFSIGFGRRLVGFTRGGTDYRLSLIPLGGYCRFAGEQSFRDALEQSLDRIPGKEGEYYAASPGRRIAVALSGPLANILFAVLVFTLISWIGYAEHYTEPRIILASEWSDARDSWPADEAGLESGDLIAAVDGVEILKFSDLRRLLVFKPGETLTLTVLRDGRRLTLTIVPRLDRETGVAIIGVLNWVDPVVGYVESSSPLRPGDRILSTAGRPVRHTVDFFDACEDFPGDEIPLVVDRDGRTLEIPLFLPSGKNPGIGFRTISGRSPELGFFGSVIRGAAETLDTFVSTLRGLRMLFMGTRVNNAVSGPIRLISDTGSMVAEGFRAGFGPGMLWSFELMSLISISLAFLNLLPIPVLDGGQILLFAVEAIRRRPLPPKSVYRYQFVGTIIVLIIAVAATTGDLMHFKGR